MDEQFIEELETIMTEATEKIDDEGWDAVRSALFAEQHLLNKENAKTDRIVDCLREELDSEFSNILQLIDELKTYDDEEAKEAAAEIIWVKITMIREKTDLNEEKITSLRQIESNFHIWVHHYFDVVLQQFQEDFLALR